MLNFHVLMIFCCLICPHFISKPRLNDMSRQQLKQRWLQLCMHTLDPICFAGAAFVQQSGAQDCGHKTRTTPSPQSKAKQPCHGKHSPKTLQHQVKSALPPVGEPNARAEAEKENICIDICMYIPMTVQLAGVPPKTWQQHLHGTEM